MMDSKHPIRVVSKYTGLNADRIRAWEKRYHAVTPKRSKNGRRLYSNEDIERLTLLKQVSEFGRRISEVVHLSAEELKNLLHQDITTKETTIDETRPTTSSVMEYFDTGMKAVSQLNTRAFYTNFLRATANLGPAFLVEELLTPLILHVCEECRRGNLQNVHLQMCQQIMNACLMLLFPEKETSRIGNKIVIGALEPDPELVSNRSASIAGILGWNPIYLGEMADVDKIRDAVVISKAWAIIIGFSSESENLQTPNQLRWLKTLLPEKIKVIAVLPAHSSHRLCLNEIGALQANNLYDLKLTLSQLAKETQNG